MSLTKKGPGAGLTHLAISSDSGTPRSVNPATTVRTKTVQLCIRTMMPYRLGWMGPFDAASGGVAIKDGR